MGQQPFITTEHYLAPEDFQLLSYLFEPPSPVHCLQLVNSVTCFH